MFDCFCLGITVALRTGAYDLATTIGCIAERVRAAVTSGMVVVEGVGSSVMTSMESEY